MAPAPKGFNLVQFTFDSIPYVVGGVGVYEGYLFLTNTPPAFTPDPIHDFIQKYIIPLLPKYTPAGQCPTGQTWNPTTQACVADVVPCPTGQVRNSSGVCVPIGTNPCVTPTTAVAGSPLTTVTFAAPLDNASVVAGTTVPCGGTIPAGLSVAKIGVRVLAGTDASFVNQDWVEMITWIDQLAPVPGPWNVSVPIPASMAAGRYLFACHVTGTDCTAYFPYKWINITASGTQPPTCALGEQLVNGVCVPITCQTGFHLLNGVCVANNPTDAVPPTVNISSPATGVTAPNSVVNIAGVASDVGSGIAGVYVRITNIGLGTPWVLATPQSAGNWASWTVTLDMFSSGDFVGPYIVQARADDVAGNMQWSNMVTINLATTPPPQTLTTIYSVAPNGQSNALNDMRTGVYEFFTGAASQHDALPQKIDVWLQKVGTPVGTLSAVQLTATGTVEMVYGQIDVSTISTTMTRYTFGPVSPVNTTHHISTSNAIGVEYTGGTATNYIQVQRVDTDVAEGANAYKLTKENGAFVNATGMDMAMIVYAPATTGYARARYGRSSNGRERPTVKAYPSRLFGSYRFADLVQQPIRARRFR